MSIGSIAAVSQYHYSIVFYSILVVTPFILLGLDRLAMANDEQIYLRANRFVLDSITTKIGLVTSSLLALQFAFPAVLDFFMSIDAWFDFRTRRNIAIPNLVAVLMLLWLDCILLVAGAYLYAVFGKQLAARKKVLREWLEKRTPK